MVSPPKPWERNGPVATTSPSTATSTTLASSPAPSTTTATAGPSSHPPAVPDRPPTIASSSMTSPYSTYGTSPYSRLGSYGYGGLGSYGSMYGGYGGMGMGSYGGVGTYGMGTYGGMGYGGYGGMGMGMGGLLGPNGMPMDPTNPSLTQTLEATTQNTFALLHSIVQTFTGLAQMLESTFMATHSSFFAMVGVADQLGQLRNALGSVLGLFGLLRWLRELVTGRSSSGGLNHEFREFINGKPVQGPMTPPPPKTSKKPIIIFLLAIFGVPYAMSKLIRLLNERAQAQAAAAGHLVPGPNGQLPPLDPSQLTFARALYPFAPTNSNELALKENEIVAIMAKVDPRTGMEVDPRTEVESDWWKGRTRDGREGWFPKKWVEVLQRRRPEEAKKVD